MEGAGKAAVGICISSNPQEVIDAVTVATTYETCIV